MRDSVRYLIGATTVLGILAVGLTLFDERAERSSYDNTVLRQLATTNKRLDRLEKSLDELSQRRDLESALLVGTKGRTDGNNGDTAASIEERLRTIEEELIALWGLSGEGSKRHAAGGGKSENSDLFDTSASTESSSVSKRFDQKGQTTSWSSKAESAIAGAFNTTSFFAVQGGDLKTECRGSICKMEWFIPPSAQTSTEDFDTLLSIARLELVGLAAQSANLVGQTDSDLDLESERPSLAVFVERKRGD